MYSVDYIEEFLDTLSFDIDIQNYYLDKYNWAKFRKDDWEKDKIRVGVIGVTSSGKSTLINAILGSDILSSAIAPSSGQLVCCSQGKNYSAKISFYDKEDKTLIGKHFSAEELMEYSDERKNCNNEKNVKSIELQSPHFDLGREVLLIDSPGLDAFGLESHEKLTLETLVPTIDVCIYVTTMKTNSDRKAKEILNVVARYGCPLIIVQNMLDSVRPSPSGDKSREQVALDHFNRMKRIVNQSENKMNDVEIIQISAEHAKKWRLNHYKNTNFKISQKQFKSSNYEKFIKLVNEFITRKKPVIESQRIENILNVTNELLTELDSEINGIIPIESEEKEYRKIKSSINKIQDKSISEYNDVVDYINEWMDRYWESIKTATENNIEYYVGEVNGFVNDIGLRIKNIISNSNNDLSMIAKDLNVPIRDILKSPALSSFKDVKVEKKIERSEPRLVKEDGAWGGIKRFFGGIFNQDWGYKYVEGEEYTTTDLETTINNLLNRLNESVERYTNIFSKWSDNNLNRIIGVLLKEVEIEENAYKARKEAIIQNEKKRVLFNNLLILRRKLEEQNGMLFSAIQSQSDTVEPIKSFSSETKKIEVDDINSLIVKLAQNACRDQHKRVMFDYIKLLELQDYAPIILGWDDNSLKDFVWKSGIVDFTIYNLNDNDVSLKTSAGKRCFFILVNAMQIGSAEKQIRMLNLERIIKTKDYVFWVIQDFEELINGNGITEGLQKMNYLKQSILPNVRSVIWIVHDNPIYNICFLRQQTNNKNNITINEEHEIISFFKSNYVHYCNDEVIQNIDKIIRCKGGDNL